MGSNSFERAATSTSKNSLFRSLNSLFAQLIFPVSSLGKSVRISLKIGPFILVLAVGVGRFPLNSLYFPCLTGNSAGETGSSRLATPPITLRDHGSLLFAPQRSANASKPASSIRFPLASSTQTSHPVAFSSFSISRARLGPSQMIVCSTPPKSLAFTKRIHGPPSAPDASSIRSPLKKLSGC